MRSILQQCPECCECPEPVVLVKSRSASKSKCGFPEFSGPTKRYLVQVKTITATINIAETGGGPSGGCCGCSYGTFTGSATWGGTQTTTYDSSTCTADEPSTPEPSTGTVTNTQTFADEDCPPGADPCPAFSATSHCSIDWDAFTVSCLSLDVPAEVITTTPNTHTSSRTSVFDDVDVASGGCGDRPQHYDYSRVETKTLPPESEYTTALLKTDLSSALSEVSYTSFAVGAPVAALAISSDELDGLAEESIYKIRHKTPKIGGGRCYQVQWVARFTPEEGEPSDTEGLYTWDGVTPEDYDPSDPETWPESEELEFPVPEEPGETTFGYYEDPEDPDSFVEGVPIALCRGCTE